MLSVENLHVSYGAIKALQPKELVDLNIQIMLSNTYHLHLTPGSELIAKADALKNSTDWQKTSQDLIKLQDAWKKYPSNGDKDEPKLFHRFRQACNAFFEAKKNFYETLDASFESNLDAKE